MITEKLRNHVGMNTFHFVLFSIFSFGLYALYWMMRATDIMRDAYPEEPCYKKSAIYGWIFLLIVGLYKLMNGQIFTAMIFWMGFYLVLIFWTNITCRHLEEREGFKFDRMKAMFFSVFYFNEQLIK